MSTLQTRTVPSRPEPATSRRPSGVNAMSACQSVSGPGIVRTSPRPAGETSQTLASPEGWPHVRSRLAVRSNETLQTGLAVAAEHQGLAELPARDIPGPREPVHASSGYAPPVAAELDVEDRPSVGANDVQLLAGRQPVELELAAFHLTGDEERAVGVDVEVHDPGGTARIRDNGDLLTGRDVEYLRHDRRGSGAPLHGDTAMRSRPTNATPSPQATPASVRSWTPANVWSSRPVRTSQTRTARSAPSVASRVPSALNRVAKTPPRCARSGGPGRRWRHSRASRCRRRLRWRRACRPGRTRPRGPLLCVRGA